MSSESPASSEQATPAADAGSSHPVRLETSDSMNSDTTLCIDDVWTLPGPDDLRETLAERYNEADKSHAWAHSAELVKTYNDELVDRWKEEMDTLLVYAGLFSAVLTAFNVQSYQLLQPQPTDPTLAVLQQISAQLTSFSVNPSFLNSTQPALSEDEVNPPFRAPASAVWINTLWFSSLVCSLASASIALMVKQWLHELSVGVSGTSRESARIRQYRVNSLRQWRVGGIVIVIPILLQLALVLFLVGLVILLWTLHGTVAAVASGLVGTLFVFLAVTTLLPVLRVDCCYRSPQAIGIFIAFRGVRRAIRQFIFSIVQNAWNLTKQWRRTGGLVGSLADFSWRMYAVVSVAKKELPSWYGREQLEVAKATPALEGDLVAMAYTTTFDAGCLDKTRLLLVDLPWKQAMACYDKIFAARVRVWGEQVSRVQDMFPQHTYDMLRIMLTVGRTERDHCWEDGVMALLGRLPPQRDDVFDNNGLKLMCILAMDNNPPADTAFLQVVMHLRKQGVLQTESTSSGIRTVMVMAEWRARNPGGSDPSTTLRHYLQSVELIIHCALRQTTPGLSPEERAAIRTRTQSAFASFRDFLRTSLWREPSLYICLGLSNMVPLLVELVQQDRELVTDELVEVLSSVWLAVQEDELGMAGGNRLRRLHAYVEWTGEVLEALKAAVSGKPVNPSTSHAFVLLNHSD
ncbi:hypothetical protein TRAPUB_3141 [Trametes pubescens]|uniref:DUF6535 domain-containing protein n=1 Tax=Trametes pubescens TaxID=154538 RepID=A0A1M2VEE8_TRAPU|nr:hypothetical protein TRAPUB_3141 [Trametes pubescens]